MALVLVLGRHARRWAAPLLLAGWAALTVWRLLCLPGADPFVYAFHPQFRGSGLLLGAALAFLPRRDDGAPTLRLAAVAGLGLAAGVLTADMWTPASLAFWVPLAEIWGLALLLAALSAPPGGALDQLLGNRTAIWLGERSFGIYLWHYPVVRLLREVGDPAVTFALTAGLSVLLSDLSWRLVEKPLSRPREGRSPPVSAPAAVRTDRPAPATPAQLSPAGSPRP